MMFAVNQEKIYGFKKDKFIAISVVIPKNITKLSHASSSVKSISKTESKNIDVNNLFSDVWTQKVTPKPKKVNSKRIQDIARKLKTVEQNSVDKTADTIEKTDENDKDKNEEQRSAANEVNEYLAKIQAIVYQHFHVPPNSEGNSVKTVIELDALGRMTDFRILNYSSNEALNSEVDKIKERLKNVVFPQNPQGQSSRTIVVLISKE